MKAIENLTHFRKGAVAIRRCVTTMLILVVIATISCLAVGQGQSSGPQSPAAQPKAINPRLPTIFVVGDSTANSSGNGAFGWGDPFIAYFDLSKVNVLNRARPGRSSRTFITEGLWDKVLSDVKAGDFV